MEQNSEFLCTMRELHKPIILIIRVIIRNTILLHKGGTRYQLPYDIQHIFMLWIVSLVCEVQVIKVQKIKRNWQVYYELDS